MVTAVASPWHRRRRRIFQSVFQTDVSQPTPQSTPSIPSTDAGHGFGGPLTAAGPSSHLLSEFRTHSGPLFSQPNTQDQGIAHAPTIITADPSSASSQSTIPAQSHLNPHPSQPPFTSLASLDNQQAAYDRAWHVVTARIVLPSSATADDSFGTLPPDSQRAVGSEDEFYDALSLIIHAPTLLPQATQTEDIVAWHAQQVRAHFSQHVIPLLSGCLSEEEGGEIGLRRKKSNYYERHMVIVMSSIRTLEAALRLYFYGLSLLLRGFSRLVDGSGTKEAAAEAEQLGMRFRRDIHALVGNSASEGLMKSVSVVLARLANTILGVPCVDDGDAGSAPAQRPAPPAHDDLRVLAARQRLHQLVEQLHNVGLAGERFQILFAEIMDSMMSDFVRGAYAGVWSPSAGTHSFPTAANTITRPTGSLLTSPCITSLGDWVENHFARLSFEVLSRVLPDSSSSPVSLSDVKTYQSLALGRLAALRIDELFDIVLVWPSSRGALEDLRATITTTARRMQLTGSFSHALQTRLLHPGCSTLDILRTYIAIIRTLHALDNSKVLLSHVEPSLQLYLCQREDAVRVVVNGLLASPDEVLAAKKVMEVAKRQRRAKADKGGGVNDGPFRTPAVRGSAAKTPGAARKRRSSTPDATAVDAANTASCISSSDRLVELALLLNDPSQARRAAPDEEELDWNDMMWVPDPVDAGANYKRPRSEDVIGTLISALGSEDVFIKEFSSVVAGRLLGEPARFDQELRVLDLLKRRFGEAALQNCDVMIRDIEDSRRVDAAILKARSPAKVAETPLRTPVGKKDVCKTSDEEQYHARILSRLFWPGLEREHFLLPAPIVECQGWYEQGYEELKSKRKLTWLNQLGQARVELELEDRTVTVDCSTVEATVIHAFQNTDHAAGSGPVKRTADELYNELQMDEDLIADALAFWAGKGVLRRVAQGVYSVIETLSASNDGDAAASAPGQSGAGAAGGTTEGEGEGEDDDEGAGGTRKQEGPKLSAKEVERRAMYWQYVKGMLTNSSASMPLAQVAMMMKMLVPDGFPWSAEELQDFLGEKIAGGELEVVGGKYRLKRK